MRLFFLSLLDSAERFEQDQHLSYRGLLATLPFVLAFRDELLDLCQLLLVWDREAPLPPDAHSIWRDRDGYHDLTRLYLLGLVEQRLGNEEAALNCAAQLDTLRTERHEPVGLQSVNPITAQPVERLFRAELLLGLGRHEEARRWYESVDGWGPVTVEYARYLELMPDCDPEFMPQVEATRQELTRL